MRKRPAATGPAMRPLRRAAAAVLLLAACSTSHAMDLYTLW